MALKKKKKVRSADKKQITIAAASIGIITFLVFLQGVFYGFINFDDLKLISGNRLVQSANLADLGDIFSYLAFTPYYKPLVYISWIAERTLFGLSPQVIHFNNAVLHAVNALLVFFLSRRLLPLMWPGLKQVLPAAGLCALAWALHPFRIESVTWAVERKDVLFAMFYLLACLNYMWYLQKGRKKMHLAGSALFYLLSILSKSMGVTFLGVAVLLELLVGDKRTFEKQALLAKLPLTAVFIAGLYLLGFIYPPDVKLSQSRVVNAAKDNVYVPDEVGGSGILQFAAIANFRLVGFACHTVLPIKIALVYPREQWLKTAGPWIYSLFAVPLFFLALLYLKKGFRRNLGFGLLWFAVAISPILVSEASGTNFLSDRYTYIPSLGLVWIIIPWILTSFSKELRPNISIGHVTAGGLLLILVVSNSIHIRHWQSSLALWENVIQKYPVNWYAYYNRAKLISSENPELAMTDLNRAIAHLPNQAMLYFTRGTLKMDLGKHAEAVTDFDLALQYQPEDVQSWINRGSCYRFLKRYQEALNDFTTAYSFDTKLNSKALNNRALTLLDMGRIQAAIDDLTTIINTDPGYTNAYLNRANAFLRAEIKRYSDSVDDFDRYLQVVPDDHGAIFRRGFAYASQGRHDVAIQDFNRAIEIQPDQGFYYYGRAQSFARLRRNQDALRDYQKAQQLGIRIDPSEIDQVRG